VIGQREAHAYVPLAGWIAGAEARHGKYAVGQRELVCDGAHLITNDADRAAAKAGRLLISSAIMMHNSYADPAGSGVARCRPCKTST
jgi:hypothetical protein